MFEQATRMKLRFSYRGTLTTEDLWDLNRNQLNELYGKLTSQRKSENGDSLITEHTKASDSLDLSIQIVKHIFEIKEAERLARVSEKERAERKEKIMAIIAQKQDTELASKSVEELTALINAM